MASNRRGTTAAHVRCDDDGLIYGAGVDGPGADNQNVAKEVRAESIKLRNTDVPHKPKPEKAAMAKADVVKGGYIGLKDGTVGVIAHAAVGSVYKGQ